MPIEFDRNNSSKKLPVIGNGHLDFFVPIAGVGVRRIRVYGGPFLEKPESMKGVCLREEMSGSGENSVHFPIQDFSVPDDVLATQNMVAQLIEDTLMGDDVYVGCMAGRGRTGLVLSLLVKAMRITDDPVAYVRKHYYSHAVETEGQRAFVDAFPSNGILESAVQRYMNMEQLATIAWKKVEEAKAAPKAPPPKDWTVTKSGFD